MCIWSTFYIRQRSDNWYDSSFKHSSANFSFLGITDKLSTDNAIILIDFEDKNSFVSVLEPLLRDRKRLAEMADKGKKILLDYRIENYVQEFMTILREKN